MEDLRSALDSYFELQRDIHGFFGYREDWTVIPLEDQTEKYWMLAGGDERGAGGTVVWSDSPLTAESIKDGNKIFSGPVYTNSFLPKWVWRHGGYTMISVDTQTDSNKFLGIFDDSKECRDEGLVFLYRRAWGT